MAKKKNKKSRTKPKPAKPTASNISTKPKEVEQKQTDNNKPTPKKKRIKSFIAKLRKVSKDKLFWLNLGLKILHVLYRISMLFTAAIIITLIFIVASLIVLYLQSKGIINNNALIDRFLIIGITILSALTTIVIITAKENNKLFKILPTTLLTTILFIVLLYLTPKLLLDSVINAVNNLCTKYEGYDKPALLSYFGAIIGAALAVLGAFLVMKYQLWSQKNQDIIKQEKQEKEEIEICKLFTEVFLKVEMNWNIKNAKFIYNVYKDNGLFDSYDKYLKNYKEKGFFAQFFKESFDEIKDNLLQYNNVFIKDILRNYKLITTLILLPDIELTEEELKQLKLDLEEFIK